MDSKYKAAMVLSGVCDAMGYRNGRWEFTRNGEAIHQELKKQFGCVGNLKIEGNSTYSILRYFWSLALMI